MVLAYTIADKSFPKTTELKELICRFIEAYDETKCDNIMTAIKSLVETYNALIYHKVEFEDMKQPEMWGEEELVECYQSYSRGYYKDRTGVYPDQYQLDEMWIYWEIGALFSDLKGTESLVKSIAMYLAQKDVTWVEGWEKYQKEVESGK